ncbi:MAG: glycosyltransferase, partial [Cyanobacteria bacterium J06600_6]
PFLNISGCMPLIFEEANCEPGKHDKYPIRLLFAGKIESEHGIEYLIETLSLVSRDENIVSQFEIDICGKGSKSNLISKFVEKEEKLWVNYHGFVSNANYQQLLSKADVCIALQNPNGRYGTYKTPSKVYEYLGNGKMVITTKAGDLGFLPSDVLSLCDFDDGQSLYKELAYIANNSYVVKQKSEAAGRYARQNFAYDKVGEKLLKFLGS